MQRPTGPMSSSSGRRPRSAGSKTRTRSYFDSREGQTSGENESDTAAISTHHDEDNGAIETTDKDNNDGNDNDKNDNDDEATPPFSLLGNFEDDDNAFEWEQTRTIKPQNHQFANEIQFNFSTITTLLLTGRLDISISDDNTQHSSENLLCLPGNPLCRRITMNNIHPTMLAVVAPSIFCFYFTTTLHHACSLLLAL